MSVTVIKPLGSVQGVGGFKVFLAGSIEMGTAEDWQQKLTDHLESLGKDITVFNPRRDNWDPTWEQSINNPQFCAQVQWELQALDEADLIVMYLDPNTKSPISLVELGLHAKSGKIIVCCPDGFYRKGNVDIVCMTYGIPNYKHWTRFIEEIDDTINPPPKQPPYEYVGQEQVWPVQKPVGHNWLEIDELNAKCEDCGQEICLFRPLGMNDLFWVKREWAYGGDEYQESHKPFVGNCK